jgi:threonine 3-dehydrogenase
MMKNCYLITGGNGNLARQLSTLLGERDCQVVLLDTAPPAAQNGRTNCEYVTGDITDPSGMRGVFARYKPTHVLHFASILSGKAEEDRRLAWRVNANATFELMELAVESKVTQFFLPSTGATYGRNVPDPLPPDFPQWPENLYGVTKVAIERLGHYHHAKHGLDFRCLRFPVIISRYAPPAAVSAYASHAFVAAAEGKSFSFPVPRASGISTIYIKDVLGGIIRFLDAPAASLSQRAYNLHSMAPTAEDIALAIAARIPGFSYRFEPIEQVTRLIDAWPFSHIDQSARADWGWSPRYDLARMADDFLAELLPSRPSIP